MRRDTPDAPTSVAEALNVVFGEHGLADGGHLEVEKHAYRSSVAAEKRSVFMVKDDIDAPVNANPLPPCRGVLAEIEILKNALRTHNQVSFASYFGAQGDIALLFVAVGERYILRHITQIARIRLRDVHYTL